MSGTLFRHILRGQRLRLLFVVAALMLWGFLMPTIYKQFGVQFKQFVESGMIPEQFTSFGGGDVFTLPGSIALGFAHPIAVSLVSVFSIGLAVSAIAGERQRGTLEVLLSRPLSRRRVYLTYLVAVLLFVALAVLAVLAGGLIASSIWGITNELTLANVPLAWLNAILLFGAYAAVALAASVSFDRLAPAAGIALAVLLVTYFMEILGSLWPDAKGLQPYSLFHYLRPREMLTATWEPTALLVPLVVMVCAIAYALWAFPRRDIAAPS
jgi:ABC-2 type transport system permease protein